MRYFVLLFLCLAAVIAYVQRSAIGAPSKKIEAEFGVGPDDMGVVMSVWYWAYALSQLPAGWVADRIGSKSALILFATVWSLLTGLVGMATSYAGLLVLWGLMGCAQAGIFPCCTKAIRAIFPPTGQAFASGMLTCCMSAGAALAQVLTGLLLGPLTWQQIFVVYAIPGLVWAVAFALLVPRPDPTPTMSAPKHDSECAALPATPVARWTKLVTDPQMLLICLQQFLRAAAMVFFFTWFPRFLQETKGLDLKSAGALAAWPPVGGMLGGITGGLFSDWVLRRTGNARLSRQGMAVVAMSVCAAVALTAYFVADPDWAVLLISVGAFFGIAGGVSGYAVAIAYGGQRVATVFATMNMSGNIGAALFPAVVGWLVALTGDWNLALLLFAALFALDAVVWAVLNPKGTLYKEPS